MVYDIYIQTLGGGVIEGDGKYFHFDWTTMRRTLDAMDNFGMLVDLPIPSLPQLRSYGLANEDFLPGVEVDTSTRNRIAEYSSAYQAFKDASQTEPKGIPRYKIEYNHGFLVTVAEITAALITYEAHPHVAIAEMPVGDLTWPRWVDFLRRARQHGGLRTY